MLNDLKRVIQIRRSSQKDNRGFSEKEQWDERFVSEYTTKGKITTHPWNQNGARHTAMHTYVTLLRSERER